MTQQTLIDIGSEAIIVTMKIAAPALLAIMVTGLVISLLQAATQVNEQTLSFIPKILAMTAALIISGPWILRVMIYFTRELFNKIPLITQ